jgi:hypothetical protein
MSGAYPNENRHTGSTNIVVFPQLYRLFAQKPDKTVLATHFLLHWGQKVAYPPSYNGDFP